MSRSVLERFAVGLFATVAGIGLLLCLAGCASRRPEPQIELVRRVPVPESAPVAQAIRAVSAPVSRAIDRADAARTTAGEVAAMARQSYADGLAAGSKKAQDLVAKTEALEQENIRITDELRGVKTLLLDAETKVADLTADVKRQTEAFVAAETRASSWEQIAEERRVDVQKAQKRADEQKQRADTAVSDYRGLKTVAGGITGALAGLTTFSFLRIFPLSWRLIGGAAAALGAFGAVWVIA